MPNADTEGRVIRTSIERFCSQVASAHYFESLGQHLYLSAMAQVDAVVGNSSSGLLEAPARGVGTINIGRRQDRRLRASSVIDCEPNRESLVDAAQRVTSKEFVGSLANINNPYGSGEASKAIVAVLEEQTGPTSLRKVFSDLLH